MFFLQLNLKRSSHIRNENALEVFNAVPDFKIPFKTFCLLFQKKIALQVLYEGNSTQEVVIGYPNCHHFCNQK